MVRTRTPAQQAASRANGARSRGPTSDEGRKKVRFNARRHGLRAETFDLEAIRALPEDPDGLRDCIADWEADLGPVGPLEHFQVGRAAVLSIRLGDCIDMEQDLRDDAMSKAAHKFLDRAQGAARHRGANLARDPAGTTELLRQTTFGCDWILRKLTALEEMVAGGGFWSEAERRLALNLMGFGPYNHGADDEPFVRQVITLALAIDPKPDRAWVDWALEGGLNQRDRAARRAEARAGLGPEAEARRALLELLGEELEALRGLREGLWREIDAPALRAAQYRARSEASQSPEGERLQRYELKHSMDFNRTLSGFYKARAQRRAEKAAPAPNEPQKSAACRAESPFSEMSCAEIQAPAPGAPEGAGAASEGRREAVAEPARPAALPVGDGVIPGAAPAGVGAGPDPGHAARARAADGPKAAPSESRTRRVGEGPAPAPNEPEKSADSEAEARCVEGTYVVKCPSGSGVPEGAGAAPEARRVAVAEPAQPPVGDGLIPASAGSDPGHGETGPESRAGRPTEGPAPAPNEPETAPASEPKSPIPTKACVENPPRSAGAPGGAGAAPEGRREAVAAPATPPVGVGPIPGAPPAGAGSDPGHPGTAMAARIATDDRSPSPAPNEPETAPAVAAEAPEKKASCAEPTVPIEAAPPGAGAAPSPAEPAASWPAPLFPDRLVFDPSVSTDRPVVRGTRFTTTQIRSRRNDPDLPSVETVLGEFGITREDFLACIEYDARQG